MLAFFKDSPIAAFVTCVLLAIIAWQIYMLVDFTMWVARQTQ